VATTTTAEPAEKPQERKIGGKITRVVIAAPADAKPRWFDKVNGQVLNDLTEKEKKRQEVIFELLTTERDYIRDLDIIINVLTPTCLPLMLSFEPFLGICRCS